MKLMAIISVVFAPAFLAVNNGGGLISYLMVSPSAAYTTSLAATAGPLHGVANAGSSNLFVAFVFLAGAFAGMGGLFVTQRVHAPPAAKVRSPFAQHTALP